MNILGCSAVFRPGQRMVYLDLCGQAHFTGYINALCSASRIELLRPKNAKLDFRQADHRPSMIGRWLDPWNFLDHPDPSREKTIAFTNAWSAR